MDSLVFCQTFFDKLSLINASHIQDIWILRFNIHQLFWFCCFSSLSQLDCKFLISLCFCWLTSFEFISFEFVIDFLNDFMFFHFFILLSFLVSFSWLMNLFYCHLNFLVFIIWDFSFNCSYSFILIFFWIVILLYLSLRFIVRGNIVCFLVVCSLLILNFLCNFISEFIFFWTKHLSK